MATVDEILKFIIEAIVPAVGGYLWGQCRTYRDKKKTAAEEDRLIKKGLQSLLRYEMLQAYQAHIMMGYATPDDKGSFEAMHASYAGLGKNGVMDKIYQEFMALPDIEKK